MATNRVIGVQGYPFHYMLWTHKAYTKYCIKNNSIEPETNAPAYCLHFDDHTVVALRINRFKDATRYQQIQLCYHEAVHVIQHFYSVINEQTPGIENQAYMTAWVGTEILKFLDEHL